MVKSALWRGLSASVQGTTHEHGGQGNQDAVRLKSYPGASDLLVIALADGHGSLRSFRSAHGSALAAECAVRLLGRFVQRLGPNPPLSRVRNLAQTRWPRELLAAWKAAVRADVAASPFSPLDFAAFPEPPPKLTPGQDLPQSAYMAYGATLLAVAVTRRFIIYSQLGDGDILTVSSEGAVARPFPRQHEFLASQTVSLCSNHAFSEFQVRVVPIRTSAPALIMASTDGYANCFGDDIGFFKVGVDFHNYLRTEGVEFVGEKLEEWLRQSSRDGSGDDITVGLAARANALRPFSRPA